MPNFIKRWSEALDFRVGGNDKIPHRPPHHNPVKSDTVGMDQAQTYGPQRPPYPQPVDWDLIHELGELKRKLVPGAARTPLTPEERTEIHKRIKELEQLSTVPPDDALAAYGLRKVPVIDVDGDDGNLAPNDINQPREGE